MKLIKKKLKFHIYLLSLNTFEESNPLSCDFLFYPDFAHTKQAYRKSFSIIINCRQTPLISSE